MVWIVRFCPILLLAIGCQTGASVAWPKDWSSELGNSVTLEGTAANAKLGALLPGEGTSIWIDGLDQWPSSVVGASGHGKRLRVTGVVIEKLDTPAFVPKEGEPAKTGIPVESEKLDAASHRFLLKDARWTPLD